LRKLILAEPGGELDASLDPVTKPGSSPLAQRFAASAENIPAGDIDGGANTNGALPNVLRTLAAHVKGSRTEMIPGATHPMFEQAPQKYCDIVLDFLRS
jgi:hypothetical protein